MKVRLLTRWNGYMSNDFVSVSSARAEMLESEGIGRIIDRSAKADAPKPEVKEEAADDAPKPEVKAKKK